jgi:hypothetical protein
VAPRKCPSLCHFSQSHCLVHSLDFWLFSRRSASETIDAISQSLTARRPIGTGIPSSPRLIHTRSFTFNCQRIANCSRLLIRMIHLFNLHGNGFASGLNSSSFSSSGWRRIQGSGVLALGEQLRKLDSFCPSPFRHVSKLPSF